MQQTTISEHRTDPDIIKTDTLKKHYNRYSLPKRNKIQFKRRFLLGKANKYGETGRQMGESTEIRKNAIFRNSAPEYLLQNF